MRWHMKFVICVQLAYVSVCLTREMSVVREWTSLDLQLPAGDGQESRRSIKPDEIKSWLMYKDRVFANLRVFPYLAYFNTDNSTSPRLRPYQSNLTELRTLFSDLDYVGVDRCDQLWVRSVSNSLTSFTVGFDLRTDSVLRGKVYFNDHSYNMIFDDFDCDNEYFYFYNYEFNHVWTYSLKKGDSLYHRSKPISQMILAPNSIVYYNVAGEPTVYYMSTTHLKDMADLRQLGRSRKLNVDLALSALDAKSDVLYYINGDNKTLIHTVPCWTSVRCSSNCQDVSIDPTHELRYITVDENGYLWAITSRSSFMDGKINFRLLSVPVKSICAESNAKDTTNKTNINEITTAASSTTEQTSTLGSVPKHTTVNITDTTAGTPNSNITHAIGGTNTPYLLFSFTNTTIFNFNLSNFTIRY